MNFGEALENVKQGKLIARESWNDKTMFVFQRPYDELPLEMLIDKVKSVPQAVKDYFSNNYPKVDNKYPVTNVPFTAYLCMKAADNSVVNGWLPSQTDMLAEDWNVLQ